MLAYIPAYRGQFLVANQDGLITQWAKLQLTAIPFIVTVEAQKSSFQSRNGTKCGHDYNNKCLQVAIKLLPRGEHITQLKLYVKREILHQGSLKHPFIVALKEVIILANAVLP